MTTKAKKTLSPYKVTEEQKSAIKAMTPETRKIHDQVFKLSTQLAHDAVMVRYEIGQLVEKIRSTSIKDPSVYGDDAMDHLAHANAITKEDLYSFARLAASFSREALQGWLARPLSNGKRIGYTHLLRIAEVGNAETRKKLVNQVIQESLTVQETLAKVNEANGRGAAGSGSGRTGRPPVVPKTLLTGFRELHRQNQATVNKFSVLRKGVTERIADMPPSKYTKKLVKDLEAAVDEQTQVVSDSQMFLDDLTNTLKRVRSVVANGKGAATATNGRPAPKKKPAKATAKKKKAKTVTKAPRPDAKTAKKQATKKAAKKAPVAKASARDRVARARARAGAGA